ncbi:hypothetical protein C8F04DRAFT_116032 [Mycena alexandri]|uniref:DUF6697 domain-containing protein n=1 Tax=Mycena alexandri TaxID=1745969 RepID=A0AAD6T973_9AGAR|nr:hypothetical protein C8F04DRAFT_116032 [Mycena alexandri]
MSNPPGILLTPDLTPEVVEFWGFKYKEVKQELEALKRSGTYDDVQTYGELKRLIELLQTEAITNTKRLEANEKFIQEIVVSTRNEQRATQQKLDACNAEKRDLLVQIGRLNTERISLHRQVQVCYSQAASLAAEADRQRMAAVAELFNSENSFIDESFTPTSAMFSSLQEIVASLPRDTEWQLYFMPRPPNSIPLRVQEVGKPGYWFYPFNLSPMDAPFDLVVETDSNTWLYFGRYTSRPFSSYEMRLSEWMTLDEQTKLIFCSRVASENSKLPIQPASYTTQIDIRQRYDSGQFNVPCYSLECVGYDMELYDALQSTATMLRCDRERDVSTISRSLGKRRRTETPSIYGLGEGEPTKTKTARIEGTTVNDAGEGLVKGE